MLIDVVNRDIIKYGHMKYIRKRVYIAVIFNSRGYFGTAEI